MSTRNPLLGMMPPRYSLLILVFTAWGCTSGPDLPPPGTDAYQTAMTSFFTSVASVQSGEDLGAVSNLLRVAEAAPGEPAIWYNLALLSARQNEFEEASGYLDQAALLAPDEGRIPLLRGLMAASQGEFEVAVTHLRDAVILDPGRIKSRFALSQELSRLGEPAMLQEALAAIQSISAEMPENLAIRIEEARLGAMVNNVEVIQEAVGALQNLSTSWSDEERGPLDAMAAASEGGDVTTVRVHAGFLRNVLLGTLRYRRDLQAVQTPPEEIGDLMTSFLALEAPVPQPAAPDAELSFTTSPLDQEGERVRLFSRGGDGTAEVLSAQPGLMMIGDQRLDVADGGSAPPKVASLDHDYNFRNDLVYAGAGGVFLFQQDSSDTFTSVNLGVAVRSIVHTNVWTADIDTEGDLDIVLAPVGSDPYVVRNNGDGTFARLTPFAGIGEAQDFAWGDFDADGDPDAMILTQGGIVGFINERLGRFSRVDLPVMAGTPSALGIADLNSDALMDLIVLTSEGSILQVSGYDEGTNWEVATVLQSDLAGSAARVLVQDFDNNGSLDVVASAGGEAQVFLSTQPGQFELPAITLNAAISDAGDLDGDGRLDLVGMQEGQPVRMMNAGSKSYHWQVLRPRAGQALGDQRINPFTIGGEMELRAGMLYQKQAIQSPLVHFGLGEYPSADLVRIIWPNGDIQAEFDLKADQALLTPQRLKGSCPWLFTYNGEEMEFVTDFIWRSPLGLRINAQETAGIAATEDWVKIRGDQLVAQDGMYDVRITAELWETHFFDHVSLLVIDHPAETDVFVDERFVFPPPVMAATSTSNPQPVQAVWDDRGNEVTEWIVEQDGRYLDVFGRGDYQGITREHVIDIAVGDGVPAEGDVWLAMLGWVRPTDSSINVAISQGEQAPPKGLQMEVPDGNGGWQIIHENLGFPSGKSKTVLLPLREALTASADGRVRLRSNLEIYWDQIQWVSGAESEQRIETHLMPAKAELVYRGFSEVTAADASSPDLPRYDKLIGTKARWRDLEGFYTRFGDVRELTAATDDRYVIMNAGDELRFQFEAPADPPDGWVRDFVLIGDGWVKDGDLNTVFSKTVLPLPTHASSAYEDEPGRLADDPVYQQHAEDWQTYHTRYVSPDRFHFALVPKAASQR